MSTEGVSTDPNSPPAQEVQEDQEIQHYQAGLANLEDPGNETLFKSLCLKRDFKYTELCNAPLTLSPICPGDPGPPISPLRPGGPVAPDFPCDPGGPPGPGRPESPLN